MLSPLQHTFFGMAEWCFTWQGLTRWGLAWLGGGLARFFTMVQQGLFVAVACHIIYEEEKVPIGVVEDTILHLCVDRYYDLRKCMNTTHGAVLILRT